MDETFVRQIVREVLSGNGRETPREIGIEASARHVHLNQEALETLFGSDVELGVKKELSQPGEFLSDKRVKLITPKGEIGNVSVLGPVRKAVQVELSATDCHGLGLKAPVNLSGDLTNAADVVILGDTGMLNATGSVIIAKAHAHLTKADAAAYGVADGDHVRVRIESLRPVTIEDVVVRVKDTFKAMVHIDIDEANACGGAGGEKAFIMGGKSACVPCTEQNCEENVLSWSESLISERTAKQLTFGNQGGVVRFKKGAIVTPAAKDVLTTAKMTVEFI